MNALDRCQEEGLFIELLRKTFDKACGSITQISNSPGFFFCALYDYSKRFPFLKLRIPSHHQHVSFSTLALAADISISLYCFSLLSTFYL